VLSFLIARNRWFLRHSNRCSDRLMFARSLMKIPVEANYRVRNLCQVCRHFSFEPVGAPRESSCGANCCDYNPPLARRPTAISHFKMFWTDVWTMGRAGASRIWVQKQTGKYELRPKFKKLYQLRTEDSTSSMTICVPQLVRNCTIMDGAGLWVGRSGPLPRTLTSRGRRKGSYRPATP
jgi:hypothetical protein